MCVALLGRLLSSQWLNLQPEVTQARQNGENMLYYSIYGDAIFPLLNCITVHHRQPLQGELTEREDAKNGSMQWIRTSAEWPYETETNLFHTLESKYNKHLLGRNREPNLVVGQQLRVLMFIYNLYVCLNGSKLSCFFNIIPPMLEEYLRVKD